MISLNLYPFNHAYVFENWNKPWRLGWRNTEARYHNFFGVHWKKPWISVPLCVVMMQKPVLCKPLVRHFLPTASINTPSTPMQNCWLTGWHWRKKLFLKNYLTVQENRQHALEAWLHLPQLSWMAGGWLFLCSWVITVKPAFISCYELGSLFSFWPVLVTPCTKQVRFVSGHLSADRHKFCSNLPHIFGSSCTVWCA